MRNILIKTITRHWTVILIGYTICYLIKSYYEWDFSNPIQWFIDIPYKNSEYRLKVLCYFVLVHGFTALFYTIIYYGDLKDKTKK